MRLIDADELLKYMETTEISQYIGEINKGNDNYSSTALYGYIKEMPADYDVDKVVGQMEEYVKESSYVDYNRAMIEAIEIVKSGGIE